MVSDDGEGLNPKRIPYVATSLPAPANVQVRSPQAYGTGLGLPLAHRILKMHGGELDLKSAPAAGTEVRMVLPAERDMGLSA